MEVRGFWGEVGGNLGPESSTSVGLGAELQQRVIAFNAGDEKYAGEWLTNFQRAEVAWQISIDALRPGPLPSCDSELLQEFCAQTIGRLSRAFGVRHRPQDRKRLRDELEALLLLHSQGRAPVWKQLCLALTCADLWLGTWSPAPALSAPAAPAAAAGLPRNVQRELLALPANLLFCDRALPLDSPQLRHAAAVALFESCSRVIPFLLFAEQGCDVDLPAAGGMGAWLQVVASWLRALRKCLRCLPTLDEAVPLRCLAAHGERLLRFVEVSPGDGAEVAQQLARWRCSHSELVIVLQPLLDRLFECICDGERQVMLPLLEDLAADCWPRAAVGELNLNWQRIAEQALSVTRDSLKECEDSSGIDAEAALGVWLTLAVTLRDGVRELPGPPSLDDVLVQEASQELPRAPNDEASGLGSDRARPSHRPEKRRRVGESWHPSRELLAQTEALPQLFAGLARALLELMSAPPWPEESALLELWDHRRAAQDVLGAWAHLVGDGTMWREAAWEPLTRVGHLLSSACDTIHGSDDVWRESEVVFWFCSALAASWPESSSAVPVASAVLELSNIDAAPSPWRALLWASASSLAATAPAEQCPKMVEWMLERAPISAGSPELMVLTEVQYAQAVERACRQICSETAHVAVGERIASLAFVERPSVALHQDTAKAQSLLLRAMSHVMGRDSTLLCQGLSSAILPSLCVAVNAERDASLAQEDSPWLAAQALFATLATAVSGTGIDSPAAALWQNHWKYLQDAMLSWTPSTVTDQPRLAAAEALTTAVIAMPRLLESGVKLLTQSAANTELPDVQLKALKEVVQRWPRNLPSADAQKAAEVLAAATIESCDALLSRPQVLIDSPPTLAALYNLFAEAVRPSPPGSSGVGPCDDRLRPLIFAQPLRFTGRTLELVTRVLPDCTSAPASGAMLDFVAMLLAPEQGTSAGAHRSVLTAALTELCAAICCALASQDHFAELEAIAPAAQVLYHAADMFPEEISAALSTGLQRVKVPDWSRLRLLRHIASRSEWTRTSEWLEYLHQIVQEWQRELRHVML
eukprot:TRINITY_DN49008_c0_g1_i1.p1 TRINITY_DN49008_c0_g1~~TRINITY_DN49008_c0_g1_i1.p1  ORF type:complete len:1066 (+),score=166.65 TRINITY_DN49008_c0_g1_i1:64-3198(+)